MKLMASLAPARAEVEAGIVAKGDQYFLVPFIFLQMFSILSVFFLVRNIWWSSEE